MLLAATRRPSDLETDSAPPGLNEDIVRLISAKKGEPEWLLEWGADAALPSTRLG